MTTTEDALIEAADRVRALAEQLRISNRYKEGFVILTATAAALESISKAFEDDDDD